MVVEGIGGTETDSFRSTSSACSSATVLSGFLARALLACRFTRPRSAIQDTVQQLQAKYLRAGLSRELFLSETRKLEHRFHVRKTSALCLLLLSLLVGSCRAEHLLDDDFPVFVLHLFQPGTFIFQRFPDVREAAGRQP